MLLWRAIPSFLNTKHSSSFIQNGISSTVLTWWIATGTRSVLFHSLDSFITDTSYTGVWICMVSLDVEQKNFVNITASPIIYRMKWGVDEFIFAISSDSEFYRLMQWLICMITHCPVCLESAGKYQKKYLNLFCVVHECLLWSGWLQWEVLS